MPAAKKLGKAGATKTPAKPKSTKGRAALKKAAKEVDDAKGQTILRRQQPISFRQTLSTGSTFLDLAISGGRIHGGGIPGGILVEVSGPSSGGKSAILAEVVASTQNHKQKPGDGLFLDPEGRLDEEYALVYGMKLEGKDNYKRPDTVTQMFQMMYAFQSKKPGIAVVAADSLAALSTDMELGMKEGKPTFEGEDKYGGRRGKEFSEGLRKFSRFIAQDNRLLICSNQIRDDFKSGGTTTPGGHAVPFYSSLRIEVKPMWRGSAIERNRKLESGKVVTKQVGIVSNCYIKKSSIDDPFREVPIYIVFRYGIDDVRGNLQFLKDMLKLVKYEFRDLHHTSMDMMIQKVEDADLVVALKEEVISLWGEIEDRFETDRQPKER